MAQGKMHSSPFHVESTTYRYAVEHEGEARPGNTELAHCPYLNKTNKYCRLWNSGYKACSAHRCHYYHWELRKDVTCDTCAYGYHGRCRHKKRDPKEKWNTSCAQYCAYYCKPDRAPK